MVTFKDGNPPSVWEEVLAPKKMLPENCRQEIVHHPAGELRCDYGAVNDIAYETYTIHWFECLEHTAEKTKRFVYLSSEPIDYCNVLEATENGRLRWKIENEGFNVQKNGGYNLEHAYSKDPAAMKVFYLILQIAHILSQLIEKSDLLK